MAATSGYRFARLFYRSCLLSKDLHSTAFRSSSTQQWSGNLRISDDVVKAHIGQLVQKHGELLERLSSEEMLRSNQSERRKLMKMMSKLQPLADLVEKWEEKTKEVAEYREMIQTQREDPSMEAMFEDAIATCSAEKDQLETAILAAVVPGNESDDSSAILEVRPGAGGREAALFTGELFRMYLSYAQFKRWRVEVLSNETNESGGLKEASASIEGEGVYRALKHERGVHRIQRVPATESRGRLHTSTTTVVVLPQPEEIESNLDMKDVRIDTFRASGAGGQHVNTTDSAVRLTHLPSGIVVSIQSERSQHKNRSKALCILRAKLFDLQLQASLEQRSQERKEQIGTAERSERIRTYNFPQDRVTDHRLNDSVHGIRDFMAGGDSLQGMIEQLTKQEDLKRLGDALAQ